MDPALSKVLPETKYPALCLPSRSCRLAIVVLFKPIEEKREREKMERREEKALEPGGGENFLMLSCFPE